jgi:hypothetical protein
MERSDRQLPRPPRYLVQVRQRRLGFCLRHEMKLAWASPERRLLRGVWSVSELVGRRSASSGFGRSRDCVWGETTGMPEPRPTMLVSKVLAEVQERGPVDRAIGQLHPKGLKHADAITTSRTNREQRVVVHTSDGRMSKRATWPHASSFSPRPTKGAHRAGDQTRGRRPNRRDGRSTLRRHASTARWDPARPHPICFRGSERE